MTSAHVATELLNDAELDLDAMMRLTELGDYATPFGIRLVADLGVADFLREGPVGVDALAGATGTHAPSLYRVLRALACQGIFVEVAPQTFGLTPMAELLRDDHPYSLKGHYQMMRADIEAWGVFEQSVSGHGSAFESVHGVGYWDYLATHPEYNERFKHAMWCMTRLELRGVLTVYDWSDVETLVDVGGGSGQMLAGVLAANPHLRGVLFDLPHVAPLAEPHLRSMGVLDRCEIIGGDFFEAVPAGADAYLLKRVLYDFDDGQSRAILTHVVEAMRPDGRVLTLDGVIRPDNRFDLSKLHDLFVLALGAGRCRTRAEMKALFADVGLKLRRVIPTGVFPLVEARLTSRR